MKIHLLSIVLLLVLCTVWRVPLSFSQELTPCEMCVSQNITGDSFIYCKEVVCKKAIEAKTIFTRCSVSNLTVEYQTFQKKIEQIKKFNEENAVITSDKFQEFSSIMSSAFGENLIKCAFASVLMVKFREANETLRTDKCLNYDSNTEEYKKDPCCNYALRSTQCCAVRDITVQRSLPGGFEQELVNTCHRKTFAEAALQQFQEFIVQMVKGSSCSSDFDESERTMTDFSKYYTVVNDCNKNIFQEKTCASDDDCFTSCNSNRKCVIPYENGGQFMVKCLARNLDEKVIAYLKFIWKLPGNSSPQDFEREFLNNLSKEKCVGPDSFNKKTKEECEQAIGCSWINCHSINSATCTNMCNSSDTSHFCGKCNGDFCEDISSQGKCTLYRYNGNVAACTQNGYKNEKVYTTWGGSNGINYCVFNEKSMNTRENCIPARGCLRKNVRNDFEKVYCSPKCILKSATNSTSCRQANMHWDDSYVEPVCIDFWKGPKECKGGDYEWIDSRYFMEPRLETEQKCTTTGYCDINRELNEQQCKDAFTCSVGCRKCGSGSSDPKDKYLRGGVCYVKGAVQSSCATIDDTEWEDRTQSCLLQSATANNCSSYLNGTWASCESIDIQTDESKCKSDNLPAETPNNIKNLLNCRITSECYTREECRSQGHCNDWYTSTYNYDTNRVVIGACIGKFETSSGGLSCSGKTQYTSIGCKYHDINNETLCTPDKGQWIIPAKNRQECEAQKYEQCVVDGYSGTLIPREECLNKCNGQMEQRRQWSTGDVTDAKFIKGEWRKRELLPLNKWKKEFDFSTLYDIIGSILYKQLTDFMVNEIQCRATKFYNLVGNIVDVCHPEAIRGKEDKKCEDKDMKLSIGDIKILPQIIRTETKSYDDVSITTNSSNVDSTKIQGMIGLKKMSKQLVQAQQESCIPSLAKRDFSLNSDTNTQSYASVLDGSNAKIGILTGDAFTVTLNGVSNTRVCIKKDLELNLDAIKTTYPKTSISVSTDSNNIQWKLSSIVLTKDDNLESCFDVSSSGTYAPSQVVKNATPSPTPETSTVVNSSSTQFISFFNVLSILIFCFAFLMQ